jgi:hypothetical protein
MTMCCTDCALNSTGLWRDLVNERELKARQADGNFACLGVSYTMNQVKLSALHRTRLKAKVIADPKETAWIPVRRQEPSARTSFQGFFRRGEVGKR